MDMITILNTIPGYEGVLFSSILGWVVFTIGIIMAFWCFVTKEVFNGFISFLVFCLFATVCWGIGDSSEPEKYECTINDGVTFADFSATFEVDEQRGEIYVVHLKEKE